MACTSCDGEKTPVREVTFTLDTLPEKFATKVTVPSVGIDFGSYFVRVAVVDSVEQKFAFALATYAADDLTAALCYAKKHLTKHDATSVFYTGHSTDQTTETIKAAFPTAKEVTRRDKLDSHNQGALLLVSCPVPTHTVFHDTSALEDKAAQPNGGDPSAFVKMFPPKMIEMMQGMIMEMMKKAQEDFPIVLSITGKNNVICHVSEDGAYKTVDARSIGGYALNTLWSLIGHPGHTGDFNHFLELASKGERRKVDTITNEILEFVGFYSAMPRNFPVFTFGKMEKLSRDQVAPEDLARATLALTSDMIMNKALDFAKLLHTYKVYYAGSLMQHEFVRAEIIERAMGFGPMGFIQPKFFKTDATAALGACIAFTQ